MSIKDIIYQDEIISELKENSIKSENYDFEEYDIEKKFEKNFYFKKKKNFENFSKNEKIENFFLKKNISKIEKKNFFNFPKLYKKKNNLLFLKASSIFENSIFFENEFFQIHSSYFLNLVKNEILLKLTFKPLKKNLVFLKNFEKIPFENFFEQKFSYKIEKNKIINNFENFEIFLKLKNSSKIEKFHFCIPFTINKFFQFYKKNEIFYENFLKNSKKILSEKIFLNKNIINFFSQFSKIFPFFKKNQNNFFLFSNFLNQKNFVLNIKNEFKNQISFTILSEKNFQVFHDFAKWFIWIFSNN